MKDLLRVLLLAASWGLPQAGMAADATAATALIQQLEGVYKHQFENALIYGEKYRSEDIIELVRHSGDALYFRMDLQFFNGHSCAIHGVAKYHAGAFVYQGSEQRAGQPPCRLTISAEKGELRVTDKAQEGARSSCSDHCGARGSLGGYAISLARKRKIRYMPTVLKSRQYREAVEAYEKQGGAR
ncbi:hypothetical protein H5407_03740 [Mitsuaria sp. WAJ17]|uniref:hypothetical protein n=1 Tax=Mitsuaria sp. WAJ17 TaxID=2761452 RepID=UPI001602FA0C|nr:hypothetical protein [Mitsuaria sp. WAJ17]MBB2484334.1 hypothetical protein [Mitsuaria sp. WAJ17]